jgi:pyruvate/2-oxoglutarate dehydrogenase complex dihydrolipoamide acyltransferase (E2) component
VTNVSETAPIEKSHDYAERWLLDALRVLRPSFVAYQTSADMTGALCELEELRRTGVHATTTHLLVWATARTLAANPSLHQIIAGSRRHRFGRVDIGLSVSGETFVSPVLVLEGADQKTVGEIAAETARRVPEVQAADRAKLEQLRRWGWLIPFGFLRRAVLRIMFGGPAYRRQIAGTFQVTTVPMESASTSVFVAAGVLVGGAVASKVVAIDGHAVVRPMMALTLSGDHGVWDGRAAARLLSGVKRELEACASSLQATGLR